MAPCRIYLLPFEWMDVTESDLHIAFTTCDSPKSFAIGLGVNLKLRPLYPGLSRAKDVGSQPGEKC